MPRYTLMVQSLARDIGCVLLISMTRLALKAMPGIMTGCYKLVYQEAKTLSIVRMSSIDASLGVLGLFSASKEMMEAASTAVLYAL
eukprot:scaffold236896_cov21-Tisochrysis_lutea.AAC.1